MNPAIPTARKPREISSARSLSGARSRTGSRATSATMTVGLSPAAGERGAGSALIDARRAAVRPYRARPACAAEAPAGTGPRRVRREHGGERCAFLPARVGLDCPPDDPAEIEDGDLNDHHQPDQLPNGPASLAPRSETVSTGHVCHDRLSDEELPAAVVLPHEERCARTADPDVAVGRDAHGQACSDAVELRAPSAEDPDPAGVRAWRHPDERDRLASSRLAERQPGIAQPAAEERSGRRGAPAPSLDPNADCVTCGQGPSFRASERQAAAPPIPPVDDDRARPPFARTAAAAFPKRPRELGSVPDVHDGRNGVADPGLPAAGGFTRGEQRERDDQGRDSAQPVHPIRRMPPYADSERYVSDMMFVPHDSHFASII